MDATHLLNYRRVQQGVVRMLDDPAMRSHLPSRYWQEEIEDLDYVLDASPAVVAKLRRHCHHLTGLRSYEYRKHHSHAAQMFRAKLDALRAVDDSGLFVPESEVLGGFGHDIDGSLVNIDTLKFYETLIALSRAGFLPSQERRACMVEIGAGWGGFAYQMKTLFPNLTYVVVDLPHSILFSATYLLTAFPGCKAFIHGEADVSKLEGSVDDFDFVFIPHYVFDSVPLPKVDLGINMVSFQEMTAAQVTFYLERLAQIGCERFYSHNRERSAHNSELESVTDILGRYYRTTQIEVLPVQYTELSMRPRLRDLVPRTLRPKPLARHVARSALNVVRMARRDPLPYKHLAGVRR